MQLGQSLRARVLQPAATRRWPGILLVAVLLLAAALRFWNVTHDTDFSVVFSQDARSHFNQAKQLATAGNLATDDPAERYVVFRQPWFVIGSYATIWRALDRAGLAGDDTRMRLGFNVYMVLFSLATVALVFLLARAIFGDDYQALFASLLFAAFPVSVVGSLYVKEDIPLMFWFAAATLAMVLLVRTGQRRFYLWTSLLIGFAIATKYSALLLLPIFLLAHLLVVLSAQRGRRLAAFFAWQPLAAPGLLALGFLCFNPRLIPEWRDYLQGFLYQVGYASDGHQDGTIIRGADYWWTFYLRYAILPGITTPATLLFLAGMVLAAIRRSRLLLLISAEVLLVYFQFEDSPAKPFPFFARYLHVIYPMMAVLATFAFFELWRWLRAKSVTRAIGVALGLVVLLVPLGKSAIVVAGARPDTRAIAAAWMEQNLPSGARVVESSFMYGPQPIDKDKLTVTNLNSLPLRTIKQLKDKGFEYMVLSSFMTDRYSFSMKSSDESRKAVRGYEKLTQQMDLVRVFQPRFAFQSYGEHNPVIRLYKIP